MLKFKPDKILYLGEEAEIVGSLFNSKANNQIVRIAGSGIEAIIKSRNPIKIIPKYLLRRLYRNSSIIIAVSKNTKMLMEGYEKFFPKEKIRLVYNGIDADFISKEKVRKIRKDLGFNENDFVLLTVGRLLPRKGQDFVIKAMSQINNPKIKYICVGEGRFLDKYKRLVNWDPKLLTAISDLEVEQREVSGSLWHIKYPIDKKNCIEKFTHFFIYWYGDR